MLLSQSTKAERFPGEAEQGLSPAQFQRRYVYECIHEGILREFLEKHRAEAKAVSIYEYDEEEHMRMEREEYFAEGHETGFAEGHEAGCAEERANTERERKRAESAEAELKKIREEWEKLKKNIK